jgi:hypothetical protein
MDVRAADGTAVQATRIGNGRMNKILHLRQFASDMVRLVDLWMLLCGAAISLFLAWLF